MIKVLHILSDSNIGGAGTYVKTLIKNYDRTKFDLSVLVLLSDCLKDLM